MCAAKSVTYKDADVTPIVERFEEYIEHNHKEEIHNIEDKLVAGIPTSLPLDLAKLDSFLGVDFCDEIIKHPDIYKFSAEQALQQLLSPSVKMLLEEKGKQQQITIPIRFFGGFAASINVRDISAKNINKLVRVMGSVNNRYSQKPIVNKACLKCQLDDIEFLVDVENGLPTICPECKRRTLIFVEAKSVFSDRQKVMIQEPLENMQGAETPEALPVYFDGDMINYVLPGQKVELTAIYRIKKQDTKKKKDDYVKFLEALHVRKLETEFESIAISSDEEKEILRLSLLPDIKKRIISSIAPSIFGFDQVKEAIAYQLFGGSKGRASDDGSKLRADSHILLIGDPGSAKTRFLQFAAALAPKATYVSGKSVTGCGLTATVTKDEDEGFVLKAGATVLMDGGACMIDEFDKIDDEDRASLHEVLESQSLSIAKAGIIAKFNARTAVLAAANPKQGRFDMCKLPSEQFNIPSTLLSRFDLIFPIMDLLDEAKDRQIADRIRDVYLCASGGKVSDERRVSITASIPMALLRKYIGYARGHINPRLTLEAANTVNDFYVSMRKLGKAQGAVPMTARQVEGLYRLAESSAKMRLASEVSAQDAQDAIALFSYVQKEVLMDKETGRFDIDIMATGTTKTKMDKANNVFGIIQELAKKYDEVMFEQIMEEAKQYNLDEVAIRRVIDELKKNGDLYEPHHGAFKVTGRR